MVRKKLADSVTMIGIILILCMFINIVCIIYSQSEKMNSTSSQIISGFDG